MATRSLNLKGTFARALKDSAASIKALVEAIRERSVSDEVRKLQAENSRLRCELDDFCRQVVELQQNCSQQVAPTYLPGQGEDLIEKIQSSHLAAVGRLIDARFAGVEEWLPSQKTLRPPLAADRKKERTTTKAPSSSATPALGRKRRPPTNEVSGPARQNGDGEWTTVTK
ncbi:unnamed protein product [Euphydryas editha]|uniref:Uncharacterized protein n=1 Tax=Euphydryas editha TaxID=104508 RepID=A0AAU9VBM1_EUPED|nr:unnamed protein product [Euphydryas editha]